MTDTQRDSEPLAVKDGRNWDIWVERANPGQPGRAQGNGTGGGYGSRATASRE
jgi:hypothetical protein